MTTLRVDLVPTGCGKAEIRFRGEFLGVSSEPLFAAARLLLSRGEAEPEDTIETYRNGISCLRASVGTASGLTVKERSRGGLRIVAISPAVLEGHASLLEGA